MIYAVDFDQTLAFGMWPSAEKPNIDLINKLIEKQKHGDKIILWTCRAGKTLSEAVELCKNNGLVFDSVNENLPEMLDMYDNNDCRKIGADVYIDDKSITPEFFMKGETNGNT